MAYVYVKKIAQKVEISDHELCDGVDTCTFFIKTWSFL